jgi:hypothetical protein
VSKKHNNFKDSDIDLDLSNSDLSQISTPLIEKIITLVENTKGKVAVYLNTETTIMYWFIGHYIQSELKERDEIKYGKQILATLSQQLSWSH